MRQRGFSILEVVIYVGLFTTLSVTVMNTLSESMRAFSLLRISRDINDSSVKVMERLTRDIKNAASVDIAQSSFGVNPGRLTLQTFSASGTPTTVEYYASSSLLRVRENGVDMGSLMSSKTRLDALVFYYINAGPTVAVKTELHVSSSHGKVSDVDHFYDTSILRGSY